MLLYEAVQWLYHDTKAHHHGKAWYMGVHPSTACICGCPYFCGNISFVKCICTTNYTVNTLWLKINLFLFYTQDLQHDSTTLLYFDEMDD